MKDISTLYSSDLENFPDYDIYLEMLKGLEKIDFSNATQKEIETSFLSKTLIIPSTFGIRKKEIFSTEKFYRVRYINDDENINIIRTYSYPSPTHCTKNGRCNLKGTSVFYCSEDPLTAILETKPELGKIGYLSEWKAVSNRDLKYGAYLSKEMNEQSAWHEIVERINNFSDKYYLNNAKTKYLHFKTLNDFVASLFLKEVEPYPITSWLANKVLFEELWRDFILYPSIANHHMTVNLAFHPNIADRFLSFTKVLRFKVLEFKNSESLKISRGDVGEIENTNIKWRERRNGEFCF